MKPDYEIDRIINMQLYCDDKLICTWDAKDGEISATVEEAE